ncbi:MAG: hypothetical protein ACI3XR_06030 [Eubacteriales bacterium]
MKKTTLLLLLLSLLACLMLVSCNKAESGQTTPPAGSTSVGGTDTPVTSSESTSDPTPTTTYPVLYTRPEIAENHPDVVPVEPIESFAERVGPISSIIFYRPEDIVFTYHELIELLDSYLTQYSSVSAYEVALVTPLEVTPYAVRLAVDHVYRCEKNQNRSSYEFASEIMAYYPGANPLSNGEYYYRDDEITVTTTGGKYVVVLAIDGLCNWGAEDVPPEVYLLPLTWELDMENVANADAIAKTNRPPFIGYAETYYLFGYGDVYEELMKEG